MRLKELPLQRNRPAGARKELKHFQGRTVGSDSNELVMDVLEDANEIRWFVLSVSRECERCSLDLPTKRRSARARGVARHAAPRDAIQYSHPQLNQHGATDDNDSAAPKSKGQREPDTSRSKCQTTGGTRCKWLLNTTVTTRPASSARGKGASCMGSFGLAAVSRRFREWGRS